MSGIKHSCNRPKPTKKKKKNDSKSFGSISKEGETNYRAAILRREQRRAKKKSKK